MAQCYEKVLHFNLTSEDEKIDDLAYALSSKTRRSILCLLIKDTYTIQEIASILNLPISSTSEHIKTLMKCGLVYVSGRKNDRGQSKVISRLYERLDICLVENANINPFKENILIDIPIGSFNEFKVNKYCGMIGKDRYLAGRDNPNIFYDPSRIKAVIIWFDYGYLVYKIPLIDINKEFINSISFSLELCSEAPLYNEDYPSDITFVVNGKDILTYTSPGDFGSHRGNFTPLWWDDGTQYGILKKIEIKEDGSYLDGIKINDIKITDLDFNSDFIDFKIEIKENAKNRNGINIFGKNAGDYNQNILCTISLKKEN